VRRRVRTRLRLTSIQFVGRKHVFPTSNVHCALSFPLSEFGVLEAVRHPNFNRFGATRNRDLECNQANKKILGCMSS